MGERTLHSINQGTGTAGTGKGFTLGEGPNYPYPDLPFHAVIGTITVRNNSRADLTFGSLPGAPVVSAGEHPDLNIGSRSFRYTPDVNFGTGEVLITVKVVW